MLGSTAVIETQLVNSQRKLEALGQLCESMVSHFVGWKTAADS